MTEPDGRVRTRSHPVVRGAALREAIQTRPSAPALDLARRSQPCLVLATEPAAARETNERLLPRFLEAVPCAEVARPGCRDPVLADLGARAGELVADWLRGLEHT